MDNRTNVALFELLLNIGNSFDIRTCANDALLSYIQELDCTGGVLYERTNSNYCNPLLFKPRILEKDKKLKDIFDSFYNKYLKNEEDFFKHDLPYIIEEKNNIYYIYKLENYGFLLFIKNNEFLSELIVKELRLINKKFSKSLQACKDKEIIMQKDEMLFHQSRMAAMGEVIQNITHQWKQPLSMISLVASGTKISLEFGDKVDNKTLLSSMNEILSKVDYLSQTINDFKSYFDGHRTKKYFFLDEIVKNAYSFLESRFKSNNIEFIFNKRDICEIYSYKNELIQIIMNIFNNAIDELETKENINRKYIIVDILEKDNSAIILIKDNAGGVPNNIFANIFKPYFTTKSKGTGIGLYMVKQLINKNLNGTIEVKNSDYKIDDKDYTGALFMIKLPLE